VIVLFASRLAEIIKTTGNACFGSLCTRPPPIVDGFVCTGTSVGDSDWQVVCRRGRERIGTTDAE
jgi:hypothetical protein